ncbi:MAG: DUF1573 domain-containing protein [Kiritimatiellae bacterium]|nr:DUF1573 domain-containing protein [Kiritimatiellia bacterium]
MKLTPSQHASYSGYRSLLACLVWACACAARAEPDSGGRIELVGERTVDFGRHLASEQKVARYAVRNGGDARLKIKRLDRGCGCTSVTADRMELKPGETSTIEVVLGAHTLAGSYAKRITIESTDPAQPVLQLEAKGEAIVLVNVTPRPYLYAGRVATNAAWAQCFDFRTAFTNVVLGAPREESNYPVSTSFEQTAATNAPYRLSVQLLPAEAPGNWRYEASIPVLAPADQPPVTIRVHARVGGQLFVIPGIAYLRPAENPDEPARWRFRLRRVDEGPALIEAACIRWPECEGVTFETEAETGTNMLWGVATFSPAFVNRVNEEGTVTFFIDYPGSQRARVMCRRAP